MTRERISNLLVIGGDINGAGMGQERRGRPVAPDPARAPPHRRRDHPPRDRMASAEPRRKSGPVPQHPLATVQSAIGLP